MAAYKNIPDESLECRRVTYGDGECWVKYTYKGKPHRDDGPAWVRYQPNGRVDVEIWHRHGKKHRDDGPAAVWYTDNGSMSTSEWYQHGKLRRDDGPAWVDHHPGAAINGVWYQNGKRVPPLNPEQIEAARILKYTEKLGIL